MKLARSAVLALFFVVACDPSPSLFDAGILDAGGDAGVDAGRRDAGPGLLETSLIVVNLIDDDPTLAVTRTVGTREDVGPPIGATSLNVLLEGPRPVSLTLRGTASIDVSPTGGNTTFVVATGDADEFALTSFDLPDAREGGSRVQLLHTSPSFGTIDATLLEGDTVSTLATDLAPGAVSAELAVPEGVFTVIEIDVDDDGVAEHRFQSGSSDTLERIMLGELRGAPYLLHVQGNRGIYPSFATGPEGDATDIAFVNLVADVSAVDVRVSGADAATGLGFGAAVELSAVPYGADVLEVVETGGGSLIVDGPLRFFGDRSFMIAYGASGARAIRDYSWNREPILPARRTSVTSFVHLAPSLGTITFTQTTTVPDGDLDPGDPYVSNAQEGDVLGIDIDRDGTNDVEWTVPALTPTQSYVAFLGEEGGEPRLVLVDGDATAQTLTP